ncbi:MAG: tRNA preQ1(34) S-adenosylmethionine ribosyltransferase-isomerase QueA [Synergistaceae bacterium]|jgi:S-adenosylmethionine:tRNA ribosyltransferase-isomerase|nr:tRNA preQ1(34) S-adenosylmethionine ribosyltransferase-isomerase QueA [Synergistaceae bacterium]
MTDIYSLDAYDYDLPESRIAQTPAVPRDSSRLLVWHVPENRTEGRVFRDIAEYLGPDDLLVLNDTRVLPARLTGNKVRGGGKVEILLLEPVESDFCRWRALVRPGRRLPPGSEVLVGDRVLRIESAEEEGIRVLRVGTGREDVTAFLECRGVMPLPPYIKTKGLPREAYQTIFAARDGSVAAPTASLHFTEDLVERIRERGTSIAWVTLHVGLGTFRPVKARDIRQHHIHSEYCEMPEATAEAVRACRRRKGRVVAVGTTVTRTLESMAGEDGTVTAGIKNTDLFIRPGYDYKVVDALVTNFHLPKSSLLMLVAAFVAHLRDRVSEDREAKERDALEALRRLYALAVAEEYRFFSFGDAMFICK